MHGSLDKRDIFRRIPTVVLQFLEEISVRIQKKEGVMPWFLSAVVSIGLFGAFWPAWLIAAAKMSQLLHIDIALGLIFLILLGSLLVRFAFWLSVPV